MRFLWHEPFYETIPGTITARKRYRLDWAKAAVWAAVVAIGVLTLWGLYEFSAHLVAELFG